MKNDTAPGMGQKVVCVQLIETLDPFGAFHFRRIVDNRLEVSGFDSVADALEWVREFNANPKSHCVYQVIR